MDALTAVVLTKNESRHIEACLESLAWADCLLVLDSLSTDDTRERARSLGALVFERPFKDYADQRNAALDLVQTDWVFFVDADERATPELAREVREAITASPAVGWWVPRRNYIFGKWIRHAGWYPDYQLRVLRRGRARYDPARQVHEVVQLDGQAGHLQSPLIHYNYQTVRQFVEKQRLYSDYEARILFEACVRPRPHNYVLQPLREFWRRYITLEGWRDGGHGLLLSVLMGCFTFRMYLRLRALWRAQL